MRAGREQDYCSHPVQISGAFVVIDNHVQAAGVKNLSEIIDGIERPRSGDLRSDFGRQWLVVEDGSTRARNGGKHPRDRWPNALSRWTQAAQAYYARRPCHHVPGGTVSQLGLGARRRQEYAQVAVLSETQSENLWK